MGKSCGARHRAAGRRKTTKKTMGGIAQSDGGAGKSTTARKRSGNATVYVGIRGGGRRENRLMIDTGVLNSAWLVYLVRKVDHFQ